DQYPAAPSPLTFGCWIDASTARMPCEGASKSVRCVSMRPEVHVPSATRIGLIARCPAPSKVTLDVLSVIVSISPVPHCDGQPGHPYPVPVLYSQLLRF